MIHDKIHEKHEFINKLTIIVTSLRNKIYKYVHEQKFINKISIT